MEQNDLSASEQYECANLIEKMKESIAARGGERKKWSLNDFELGCPLGEGKLGHVYLAREKSTHFLVAIKVLLKSEIAKYHAERQVLREIEIQTHLRHPSILMLYDYFHDEKKIYLILEYAEGGEVYKSLTNADNGRFSEPVAARYMYQVASALNYCHERNVIHRDIKPENLLVTFDGNIKLADFGWSVHAPGNKRKTICGTMDYLPPEMVERKEYTPLVDNWCLGILCYEFLVGKPPFESKSYQETCKRICSLKYEIPSYVSELAQDLIRKLLRYDPNARLSLNMLMNHPWIKLHYSKD